jgi:aspartate/tyrosine/aromatic aminotransferase
MPTHNYENPSEKQDLSHLEAGVGDGEIIDPATGFSKRKPISDRECIYKCLDNCISLAGLDKNQVERLAKQFNPNNPDEVNIESEYPPL